jgi:DNA-binding transcriptional LysR family regulator
MDFRDVPPATLRAFREVAERGTVTAAAAALGYTQSAVSRQMAALERAAGTTLLERGPAGVRLTAAGQVVLRHAAAVLEQADATARELAGLPGGGGTVRLGWYLSAGAVVVPRAVAELRRTHPAITVTTREGTTPTLVRALRSGSLDLALLASAPPFRPPDAESPPLRIRTLTERSLLVAVPVGHPFAARDAVDVADLRGQRWVASPSAGDEKLMGAWPGLDERPVIAHSARDWLAKLRLVAAGCGLTTVPASLAAAVPPNVRLLPVRGGSRERRRMILAWLTHPLPEPARHLADALTSSASASS